MYWCEQVYAYGGQKLIEDALPHCSLSMVLVLDILLRQNLTVNLKLISSV